MEKNLKILGHLFFLFFLILSIIFFKERILYVDNANFLMFLINNEAPVFASGRYAVFLTQLLPTLFVKMQLPLTWVMISYSISFVLLYYLIFYICAYRLKNPYTILPIICVLLFFSKESFFHVVTETHQGLIYCILLWAWLSYYNTIEIKKYSQAIIFYSVLCLILLLCYFSHPVTIFPILFIIGLDFINKLSSKDEKINYFKYPILLMLAALPYLLRVLYTEESSYDGQIYAQLFANLKRNFFELFPLKYIASRMKEMYGVILLLLLITFIGYLLKREIKRFFYLLTFVVFYLVIIQYSFGSGDSELMMEKNFMPLSIFIILPFTYDVFRQSIFQEKIKILLIILFATISLIRIHKHSEVLASRINVYKTICDIGSENGFNKLIISKECIPQDFLIHWGFSIETLLYSSMKGPTKAVTAYIDNGEYTENGQPIDLHRTDLFMGPYFWKGMPLEMLNKKYFDLGRSTYKLVKCENQKFEVLPIDSLKVQ